MSSAICFNLHLSKILSSGNGLITFILSSANASNLHQSKYHVIWQRDKQDRCDENRFSSILSGHFYDSEKKVFKNHCGNRRKCWLPSIFFFSHHVFFLLSRKVPSLYPQLNFFS